MGNRHAFVAVAGLCLALIANIYGLSYLGMLGSFVDLFHNDVFPVEFVRTFSLILLVVYFLGWAHTTQVDVLIIDGMTNYVKFLTTGVGEERSSVRLFDFRQFVIDFNELVYGVSALEVKARSSKAKTRVWKQMPFARPGAKMAEALAGDYTVNVQGASEEEEFAEVEDFE